MRHLDIDRIVFVLDGTATGSDQAHLEDCDRCRTELELWRRRLDGLRELESNALNENEIHHLRALYRHYGPARAGQSWLARLVRRSESTPVAVGARGSLSTMFVEYEAGPWGLLIQIKPSVRADLYDVHGQLTGDNVQDGEVLLTSDLGFAGRSRVDGHGEFHLPGVPAGSYDATWRVGDVHIGLHELGIGGADDAPGS